MAFRRRGTEQRAESVERCAGQFEKPVAAFLLHRELAVQHQEIVRHFVQVGFLESVFVKRRCGVRAHMERHTRPDHTSTDICFHGSCCVSRVA